MPNEKIGHRVLVAVAILRQTFSPLTLNQILFQNVLRGTEKNGESWTIAWLDPRQETPEVKDIAVVPFACRSLTFDGEHFWTNYRADNTIVSFFLPSSEGQRIRGRTADAI
jgi:hypothetical protein